MPCYLLRGCFLGYLVVVVILCCHEKCAKSFTMPEKMYAGLATSANTTNNNLSHIFFTFMVKNNFRGKYYAQRNITSLNSRFRSKGRIAKRDSERILRDRFRKTKQGKYRPKHYRKFSSYPSTFTKRVTEVPFDYFTPINQHEEIDEISPVVQKLKHDRQWYNEGRRMYKKKLTQLKNKIKYLKGLTCLDSPCKNGGKCLATPPYGYTCFCRVHFGGLRCEIEIPLNKSEMPPINVKEKQGNIVLKIHKMILIGVLAAFACVVLILIICCCLIKIRQEAIMEQYREKLARGEALTSLPPGLGESFRWACWTMACCCGCCSRHSHMYEKVPVREPSPELGKLLKAKMSKDLSERTIRSKSSEASAINRKPNAKSKLKPNSDILVTTKETPVSPEDQKNNSSSSRKKRVLNQTANRSQNQRSDKRQAQFSNGHDYYRNSSDTEEFSSRRNPPGRTQYLNVRANTARKRSYIDDKMLHTPRKTLAKTISSKPAEFYAGDSCTRANTGYVKNNDKQKSRNSRLHSTSPFACRSFSNSSLNSAVNQTRLSPKSLYSHSQCDSRLHPDEEQLPVQRREYTSRYDISFEDRVDVNKNSTCNLKHLQTLPDLRVRNSVRSSASYIPPPPSIPSEQILYQQNRILRRSNHVHKENSNFFYPPPPEFCNTHY